MTPSERRLEILEPGPLTTVQDLGRPGQAQLGVGTSGACDAGALRLANRLVDNAEGAAALEVTLGGLTLRALGALTVAVTGAPGTVQATGAPAAMDARVELPDGATLRLGVPRAGVRTYVAVRGGVDVDPVLGSRSTDLLAGLGPRPLRAGDVLRVGHSHAHWAPVDVAPGRTVLEGVVDLVVHRGPHDDWFTPEAVRLLGATTYTVTTDSNRVGVRLAGRTLDRAVEGELPSEGLLPGALQVPPAGRPTIVLADHPVTGGYPVIAVVRHDDLDRAGQLRPGQHVRFRLAATGGRLTPLDD